MADQIREFILSFPQRLKRVTSGASFIPEIDGLRFLAIFPVVLQHFSERLLTVSPTTSKTKRLWLKRCQTGISVFTFFLLSVGLYSLYLLVKVR